MGLAVYQFMCLNYQLIKVEIQNIRKNRSTKRVKTAIFRLTCCKSSVVNEKYKKKKMKKFKKSHKTSSEKEPTRDAFETVKTDVSG